MSNQSPTANGKDQFPEPPHDQKGKQWSPEQPVEKGKDMAPDEMEDFEEGVVQGDTDSDAVPPPPVSPD